MPVLYRKLWRSIARNWGQSLAVTLVVLCGIANYIAVHSAYLNLQLTRDAYNAQYRFADFEIMVARAPEAAARQVAAIPGVREARTRIVEDVTVDLPGVEDPRSGRVISMPAPRAPVLNDVFITRGRYFEAESVDEVLLSERFAIENSLDIGDRVPFTLAGRRYAPRIVGLGLSPEYVYMIRGVEELLPSPEGFGVLWVPERFAESALDLQAGFNNLVGSVENYDDIERILDQAEALLEPYGVYAKIEREDQISYRFVSDEIQQMGVLATVVPALFLGVAALILLVLLNRTVRTERTQIGLLKAFGYSDWAVAWHYMAYALALSLAGCLGGFALGQWLSGGLVGLYIEFYQFPVFESQVYPEVLATAMGLSVLFAVLGALHATHRAARIAPAEAMQPEAPASAHAIWIESIGFIWRRIGFSWRMILRNIARNPLRFAITGAGAAVSVALLLVGFFTMDAMYYAIRFQFQDVQREDVRVAFYRERGMAALHDIARFPHVRRAEPTLQFPVELRNGWRRVDTVVIGLPENAELRKVMGFDRVRQEIPREGVVLSRTLARDLGVGPGEAIDFKPLKGLTDRERRVRVAAVADQFLGANGYMDIHALSRLIDESLAMNTVLLRIEQGGEGALNRALKDAPEVAGVSFSVDAYKAVMDTLAESMRMTNAMLLIFAGLIAFAIIYNVTSVSLAERQRELASLRVLGMSSGEVGAILYRENFLAAALGVVAGLPLGYGLCQLLVLGYDTDLYRLPFHLERDSYVLAVALTLGFVALANLAAHRKVLRLDMVEVLKSRE